MKKLRIMLVFIFSILLLAACSQNEERRVENPMTETSTEQNSSADNGENDTKESVVVENKATIILATTTSTQDSGLLDYLLPVFTKETGWEVDVVSVGTGAAMQMGRDGDADVLLVHARADEDKFVLEGYADERFDVMYNDFIVVGPADGGIELNDNVEDTFEQIVERELVFVSRGDDSGTHKKELSIWKKLNINTEDMIGYISSGQGMGATLSMANEMKGYTLTDRATWLAFKDADDLSIICENNEELFNYYGVLPVSALVNDKINVDGGQAFAEWITKKSTQELISQFGVSEYGESLFTPNAR